MSMAFTVNMLPCFQFNMKDGSVKLAYEAQPRPKAIASLAGETIVKVACGANHTGITLILFFAFQES